MRHSGFLAIIFCIMYTMVMSVFMVDSIYAGPNQTRQNTGSSYSSQEDGADSSNSSDTNSTKSMKQTIKDSSKDAANSIIEQTFQAIGASISQSTQKVNNLNNNNEQDMRATDIEEKKQNGYPTAGGDGRRPRESRW